MGYGVPTRLASTLILFDHDPSRGQAVPKRLLADCQGAILTDGYKAYGAYECWLIHFCDISSKAISLHDSG